MRVHLTPPAIVGSTTRRRPADTREGRQRQAEAVFAAALGELRRPNLDRARYHLGRLFDLGFSVERVGDGYRLVDHGRGQNVLPLPAPRPMPVAWFARLVRSLADGDTRLESRALAELSRAGFGVTVGRENRKGVSR